MPPTKKRWRWVTPTEASRYDTTTWIRSPVPSTETSSPLGWISPRSAAVSAARIRRRVTSHSGWLLGSKVSVLTPAPNAERNTRSPGVVNRTCSICSRTWSAPQLTVGPAAPTRNGNARQAGVPSHAIELPSLIASSLGSSPLSLAQHRGGQGGGLALRYGRRGGGARPRRGVHVGGEQSEKARALDHRLAACTAELDYVGVEHDLPGRRDRHAGWRELDRVVVAILDLDACRGHRDRIVVGIGDRDLLLVGVERDRVAGLVGDRDRAVFVDQQLGAAAMVQPDVLLAVLVVELEDVTAWRLQEPRGGRGLLGVGGRVAARLPERSDPDRPPEFALLGLDPHLGVRLGDREPARAGGAAERQARERPVGHVGAQHRRDAQLQAAELSGILVARDEASVLAVMLVPNPAGQIGDQIVAVRHHRIPARRPTPGPASRLSP